ncbi:hypothetical protein SmJEL517_g01434 [Synchytrium microbalum]|uniref:START domain-containing protein n=1 Tax=Synchytrium microbalum TaxID=1806994 RepID=A0A507CAD0_9FUNG|nr:uncharacterized protein SmJEL517_g01434 [Synchytrium microbalum]TPX36298.1 hypothetical protein SmJEL517_g01434 [Synchytrium microbalum]
MLGAQSQPDFSQDPAFTQAIYMEDDIKHHIIKSRLLISQLADSSDWVPYQQKNGITLTTLDIEGDPLPAIRGSAEVDIGVEELIRCIRSAGARQILDTSIIGDPRFVEGHLVRHLGGNNNSLYSKMPGVLAIVAPRYIYGVQQRYYLPETDTHVILVCSLPLSDEAPMPKGHITVDVKVAGWYLKPLTPQRTEVSYYALVDPAGTIPSFVARLASSQAGLCVATVRDYINDFGAPMGMSVVGALKIERFEFEHKSRMYDFRVTMPDSVSDEQVKDTYMEVNVDRKMYPSGVSIVMTGNGAEGSIEAATVRKGRSEACVWVKIFFANHSYRGTSIFVCTKNESGPFTLTLNDKELPEVETF